jgi:hypothetical protein
MRTPDSVGSSTSSSSIATRNGSSFDGRFRAWAVARRLRQGQRPADRVAVDASAAVDLALREALDLAHPPDLRPLLHAKQRLSPVSIVRSSQIKGPVGRLRPRAGWTTFRPAQADQYSGGAYSGGVRDGSRGSRGLRHYNLRHRRPTAPSRAEFAPIGPDERQRLTCAGLADVHRGGDARRLVVKVWRTNRS